MFDLVQVLNDLVIGVKEPAIHEVAAFFIIYFVGLRYPQHACVIGFDLRIQGALVRWFG